MTKPICLITGVGDTTGSALARRFTDGGYQVAMIARNAERLHYLETELVDARSFVCDLGDLEALVATVQKIHVDMGAPSVLIHNAVASTFEGFLDAAPEELEQNFRVNTTALLYLARQLAPSMIEAGRGAIIATGNTASHRGVPNYALFAPTKAAQRILAQSLARDLGPRGVHVAYVTIDAAIDVTWLGSNEDRPPWLLPPPDWPWPREDFFAKPNAIADEVFHIAHQDRSTWTFDLVIRPFAEKW